jgi:hypothetical protein
MFTLDTDPNYTVKVTSGSIHISGAIENTGIVSAQSGLVYTNDAEWLEKIKDYIKMQELWNQEKTESIIRQHNPAVQSAWEQYRILVELARD